MNALRYTRALVRHIPMSMKQCLQFDRTKVINIELAKKEQQLYIEALKSGGLDVYEIPADEKYPDCVFIEDTAVVVGQRALITKLGDNSRRGEVGPIREALRDVFNIKTHEVEEPFATIDGGDVIYTGREFFVGLSNRTNQGGADAVQKTFPDIPVTPISLNNPKEGRLLHLTEIMTMFMEDTIAIRGSDEAKRIRDAVVNRAKFDYKYLHMERDTSVNMVYFNKIHVHLTRSELGEKDYKTLSENTTNTRIELPNKENDKADGSLTCRSILIE